MGVSHGFGLGCFSLVLGIGIVALTQTETLFFCWICVFPLLLAGVGFFIPNKDNTVVIYQDKISNTEPKKIWKEDFYNMDTNKDGVISESEFNK